MTYERKIKHKLAAAEAQEATDDKGEMLVASLRELLENGGIDAGVRVEFGDDTVALQQVLELLDVASQGTAESALNFVSAIVGYGGTASHIATDRVDHIFKDHGVIGTIELLQAKAWWVSKAQFMATPMIASQAPVVSSRLTFARVTEGESGGLFYEPGSLTISVGVTSRYQPEVYDEYGNCDDSLAYMYRRLEKDRDEANRIVRLSDEMYDSTIELPSRSYYLEIGKGASQGNFVRTFGVDVRGGEYRLERGQVVRDTRNESDNFDE